MSETNPAPGVEQEDVLKRMQNFIEQSEDPAPEAEPAKTEPTQQPASQAEELTPEDLEPQEQPAVDAFEIVHNGQQVKLTREETIKHAQQGFDYTQKTQALAAREREYTTRLQQLAEIEQITPHVAQGLAELKALEAQLQPYQSVNWVQLAGEDLNAYAQHRARFDELNKTYQNAQGRFNQGVSQLRQRRSQFTAQQLQQEEARLGTIIPEWNDVGKREAGKAEVAKYLQTNGIPLEFAGRYLDNAFAVATAYKAAKYDQLVKAKGEKVKQLRTAPPVTRPGAAQAPDAAKADRNEQLRANLQKSGDVKDAAALLLNRWK